jgi:hypothetical protein
MTATASTVAAYGVHWNGHLGRLGQTIPEDEARALHDAGKLYTAVLGDQERPSAVVEVRLEASFVGVRFLDEQRRTYLDYAFGSADGRDDALFLRQAIEHTLAADGNVVRSAMHVFREDGTVEIEEKDYRAGVAERSTSRHDPSRSLEPVPAFGEYDSIARLER